MYPAAGYLVRSAKYYESDEPGPNSADIEITNSGTLSTNGCIVAQSSVWLEPSRNLKEVFTIQTITRKPDYQLLSAEERLVFGPYEDSVHIYDKRMDPALSLTFEAGEVYSKSMQDW